MLTKAVIITEVLYESFRKAVFGNFVEIISRIAGDIACEDTSLESSPCGSGSLDTGYCPPRFFFIATRYSS